VVFFGFYWVLLVFLGFIGFYCFFLGFIGFFNFCPIKSIFLPPVFVLFNYLLADEFKIL
jgi:hypothetical protein